MASRMAAALVRATVGLVLGAIPITLDASAGAEQLVPGDSIRVTQCDKPGAVVGELVHVSTDSILLRQSESLAVIAMTRIRGIEIAHGQRRRWATGWQYGAVAGLLTGVVVGNLTAHDELPCEDCFVVTSCRSVECRVPRLAFLGLVAGSLVGVAIGSTFMEPNWRPVADPRLRCAFDLTPSSGFGARLALYVNLSPTRGGEPPHESRGMHIMRDCNRP